MFKLSCSRMPSLVAKATALAISFMSQNAAAFGAQEDQVETPLASEFKQLDINHDGKLSKEEAAHDRDIAGNFDTADGNRNGSLEVDEYSRFKSTIQQARLKMFLEDSEITAKVKSSLIKDTGMKGLNISVETHKGVVILSGFVASEQQIRSAVSIASGVRGVQSVKNSLVVKG